MFAQALLCSLFLENVPPLVKSKSEYGEMQSVILTVVLPFPFPLHMCEVQISPTPVGRVGVAVSGTYCGVGSIAVAVSSSSPPWN